MGEISPNVWVIIINEAYLILLIQSRYGQHEKKILRLFHL